MKTILTDEEAAKTFGIKPRARILWSEANFALNPDQVWMFEYERNSKNKRRVRQLVGGKGR
ncbi:hypothetical protein CIG75_19135 [Tumebacillus algifaecis]|uniref:Uncharacterized protein n=1 Tax=Tumebacillus algifaecis TaxID=1214604 RepID=A0A223D5H9_9BACL|nr:hypothetical protein CIG75_19135 [Tumebacillus algifaecis]